MKLIEAKRIAANVFEGLKPHCKRIEIAGSIRREKPEVGDIEIVAIPASYETGLFESGIAIVVNKWKKIKGELPCKYTQRMLPEGIKLDLFFATPENWGYIYAIRTGSDNFSHNVLAKRWVELGYKGVDGMLTYKGKPVLVREERSLFNLLDLEWVEPKDRE